MKKLFVYILLTFYIAVQLRPLTVIVQDVLAHTFFRVQHMATVHYENGRYHLHTELETIAAEDGSVTKENTPPAQKTNDDISNQVIHDLHFDFVINRVPFPGFYNLNEDVMPGFTGINSPPPKTA